MIFFKKKKEIKVEEKVELKEINKPYPKKSLDEMDKSIKDKKIIEVMKTVQDPELGIDIWTLGLVYDVIEDKMLKVVMTFTSPMCPFGPQIVSMLKDSLKRIGYEEEKVDVEVVFNPYWEPGEELREMLGV